MEVEILSPMKTRTFSYEGQERQSFSQEAALHGPGHKYPLPFSLSIPKGQPPYEVGARFRLGLGSFKTGQYGDLQLDRFNISLEPVGAVKP